MLRLLVLLLHFMISQVPTNGHDYSRKMEVNNVTKMLEVAPAKGSSSVHRVTCKTAVPQYDSTLSWSDVCDVQCE